MDSTFLIKAAQLMLSLSILIVIHELGHYIPAKIFKTKVEKFFLFFDVKFALFKKKIGETVYGIGWLPLGGYVKIAGMIDESMDKEAMAQPPKPWEFRSKPAWQRLIIMLGGVTVNIIAAFFIYSMILGVWGKDSLPAENMPNGFVVHEYFKQFGFEDGDRVTHLNGEVFEDNYNLNYHLFIRDVRSMSVIHPDGTRETIDLPEDIGMNMFKENVMQPFIPKRTTRLKSVEPGSGAEYAGLQAGDSILMINQEDALFWHVVVEKINLAKSENNDIIFTIVRDGYIDAKILPAAVYAEKGVGITIDTDLEIKHTKYGFFESIAEGFSFGYWTIKDYIAQFKYIFTEKGASSLGGFGAIGSLFPPAWDWQSFWQTTALISIILAIMNLLPIPALDGGHVMFLLYEMITGRKPNDKFMEVAQMIGLFLLLALVLYANGNDIYRYFFQ